MMTDALHLLCLLIWCICISAFTAISQPAWAETAALNAPAADAAKLLDLTAQIDELRSLKTTGVDATPNDTELALQVHIVKRILGGTLEVRKLTDQIDNELAIEYTAQSEMIASRNLRIELNNIANFTQNGVIGVTSGGFDLKGKPKTSNILQMTSGSTTLLLASLSVIQTRGGKRKQGSEPNMLGQVLKLSPPEYHCFSPLMLAYLNAVPPNSTNGMSRREQLIDRWKKAGVLTVNLEKQNNLEKLAAHGAGHTQKSETIKLIQNRIIMLHDVHTLVESLDSELVALLQAVD